MKIGFFRRGRTLPNASAKTTLWKKSPHYASLYSTWRTHAQLTTSPSKQANLHAHTHSHVWFTNTHAHIWPTYTDHESWLSWHTHTYTLTFIHTNHENWLSRQGKKLHLVQLQRQHYESCPHNQHFLYSPWRTHARLSNSPSKQVKSHVHIHSHV